MSATTTAEVFLAALGVEIVDKSGCDRECFVWRAAARRVEVCVDLCARKREVTAEALLSELCADLDGTP